METEKKTEKKFRDIHPYNFSLRCGSQRNDDRRGEREEITFQLGQDVHRQRRLVLGPAVTFATCEMADRGTGDSVHEHIYHIFYCDSGRV